MGRLGLVMAAVMMVACTHAASTSPAWPKAAKTDKDGGESIAPHESKQIVAIEKVDDTPAPAKTDAPAVEAKPAAATATPAPVAPAAGAASDETLTTEDIIIEIDD